MTTLIADFALEESLREQRSAWGADRHDEVWEGVYFMPPAPNTEHQELLMGLGAVLYLAIDRTGLGKAFPGVNLATGGAEWRHDYRVPDIVVFLKTGAAENRDTHWTGGADFVVEIASPGDRCHEKVPFYSSLGVRELLIVNRHPWALELYRLAGDELQKAGEATLPRADALTSSVLPLKFQLTRGDPRPQIEVTRTDSGERWVV